MKTLFKTTALLAIAIAASQVYAYTSDELFNTAMTTGIAEGVLTGVVADRLKQQTHSIEPTQAKLERIATAINGCQTFKLTIIQPKIPKREGGFAGDYTAVTKPVVCNDGREQAPPEVLDCKVGTVSCMPTK
jgi:hypothetical protein